MKIFQECYHNEGPLAQLSLIQVATLDKRIFVFDVLEAPEILTEKSILPRLFKKADIMKVIHNSGLFYASIALNGCVCLKKVFDVQCAHAFVRSLELGTSPFQINPVTLEAICEHYANPEPGTPAAYVLDTYRTRPLYENPWMTRPLSAELKCLAAAHAGCLVPDTYKKFLGSIQMKERAVFYDMCTVQTSYYLDPMDFAERRLVIERALLAIRQKTGRKNLKDCNNLERGIPSIPPKAPSRSTVKPKDPPLQQQDPPHQEQGVCHREQAPRHQEQDAHHQEKNHHHQEQDPHHQEQDHHHPEKNHHHQEQDPHHQEQAAHHPKQNPHHQEQDHHRQEHDPHRQGQVPQHGGQNPRPWEQDKHHQEQAPQCHEQNPHHQEQDPHRHEQDPHHRGQNPRPWEQDPHHPVQDPHCHEKDPHRYEQDPHHQGQNPSYQEQHDPVPMVECQSETGSDRFSTSDTVESDEVMEDDILSPPPVVCSVRDKAGCRLDCSPAHHNEAHQEPVAPVQDEAGFRQECYRAHHHQVAHEPVASNVGQCAHTAVEIPERREVQDCRPCCYCGRCCVCMTNDNCNDWVGYPLNYFRRFAWSMDDGNDEENVCAICQRQHQRG